MSKRIVGVAVIALAALAIGLLAWSPWSRETDSGAGNPVSGDLIQVTGVIGSEKSSFFKDQAVIDRFAELGYSVKTSTAGSRQLATSSDLATSDFAFPSSTAAATKLMETHEHISSYDPFYSPMAIATWEPIVLQLQKLGAASETNGVWTIDAAKYLELVNAGTRWSDIPDAAAVYNSSRSVLIGSTDISTSNSAAMYAAIASYVLNGNNVIAGEAEEQTVLPEVAALFAKQGFTASSSAEPFSDYLSQGIGARPLVMSYEQQFVEQALKPQGLPAGATIAYLSPTVLSKHVVVSLTEAGDEVGRLITEDETLQSLAAKHGFRTGANQFADEVSAAGLTGIESSLTNIADLPSYDMLEKLIDDIVEVY